MRSYLDYFPHCLQDEERAEWRNAHEVLRKECSSDDLKSVIVHAKDDDTGAFSRRLALWELAYRYELVLACVRARRLDVLRLPEAGTQRGG